MNRWIKGRLTTIALVLWVAFLYTWTLPVQITRVHATLASKELQLLVQRQLPAIYASVDQPPVSEKDARELSRISSSTYLISTAQSTVTRLALSNELYFPPGTDMLGANASGLANQARLEDYIAKCRTFLRDYTSIINYTFELRAAREAASATYAFQAPDTFAEARQSYERQTTPANRGPFPEAPYNAALPGEYQRQLVLVTSYVNTITSMDKPKDIKQTNAEYTAALADLKAAVDLIVQAATKSNTAQFDQGVSQYRAGLAKLNAVAKVGFNGSLRPDASLYRQITELKAAQPIR